MSKKIKTKEDNSIFVQIASYRDPELIPTLKDLITNAKSPENLTICVCRQYHPEDKFDDLSEYKNDKRFKIIDILYNETKGVCWARNLIQKHYSGEKYTIQLDSHHRFIKNWDYELINMVKDLQKEGYKKPLLTAYVSSYNPGNDPQERAKEPWQMVFDRFIPQGAIFFKPEAVKNWKNRILPVPARFYSAHFCFTLGEFCKEVPHNPDYLFHGEEISIAARAYTHGYDLFHPHKVVVWHEYTRYYRTKVWHDDPSWEEKNKISHLINRKLFGMDGLEQQGHDGEYGFGKIRTLRDYEKYSGILFSQRAVQQYTVNNEYPPNPIIENENVWIQSFSRIFKHCIDIPHDWLNENDYDFWVVAFHNQKNETLFRKDADENEIKNYLSDPDKCCKIWREFQTPEKPAYWVVWPHSVKNGWKDRFTGEL